MFPIIEINKDNDKTIIKIIPNQRIFIKMGFSIGGIVFLISGISNFISFLQNKDGIVPGLFLLATSILLLILAKNFFSSIFEKEIITTTKYNIQIEKKFLFFSNIKNYEKGKINSVDFVSDELNTNPEKDSFEEVTGIKFYKNENNILLKKGVISFNYNGKEIRFGKDLDDDTAVKISYKVFR